LNLAELDNVGIATAQPGTSCGGRASGIAGGQRLVNANLDVMVSGWACASRPGNK
jgi:hypothetical protein